MSRTKYLVRQVQTPSSLNETLARLETLSLELEESRARTQRLSADIAVKIGLAYKFGATPEEVHDAIGTS